MQTILSNFWEDEAIGHIDSEGRDLTKQFLLNLFGNVYSKNYEKCVISSHFTKYSFTKKLLNGLDKVTHKLSSDSLAKRKTLYGHTKINYDLNPRDFNVWYTSENLRPPLDLAFQVFLSHDLDSYDGRNFYLPFWATRLGITLDEAILNQESLHSSRSVPPRTGICAIISNPEPIRMAFLQQLSQRHQVDVYGALGIPLKDKKEVLSRYRLNICFENSEAPGYVTEKPFDAWQAGCIPVWRGVDSAEFLNPLAIVDVTRYGFLESINLITRILDSDKIAQKYTEQPLLRKSYDYKSLANKLQALLD